MIQPEITDDEDWAAGWYAEIPVPVELDLPVATKEAVDGVRHFLD